MRYTFPLFTILLVIVSGLAWFASGSARSQDPPAAKLKPTEDEAIKSATEAESADWDALRASAEKYVTPN